MRYTVFAVFMLLIYASIHPILLTLILACLLSMTRAITCFLPSPSQGLASAQTSPGNLFFAGGLLQKPHLQLWQPGL